MLTVALIGLVGGVITGISPCVLPVLPVVFLSGGAQAARSEPVRRQRVTAGGVALAEREPPPAGNRRPYLVVAGLALSFSLVTLLGTLVLAALPVPQDAIRWAGLVLLVLLGIGMIAPPVERCWSGRSRGSRAGPPAPTAARSCSASPSARCTSRAPARCWRRSRSPAPPAGSGPETVVLTVAFATGTALPLLGFALAGRRLAERLQAFRRHQTAIRIGAGVVVIGLAVALTFNVTDAIQRAVPDYTAALNKDLGTGKALGTAAGPSAALASCEQAAGSGAPRLRDCGTAPPLAGIAGWLNTPGGSGLDLSALHGKVVLVDFWAYSCINCQRAIAHVNAWYAAYRSAGFEVIGVHTPEYAFEHVPSNVAAGAKRLGIQYPVALDNGYATWNNYGNDSWPADYLIDASGTVRFTSVGEGRTGRPSS